jgi:hypothetical protein
MSPAFPQTEIPSARHQPSSAIISCVTPFDGVPKDRVISRHQHDISMSFRAPFPEFSSLPGGLRHAQPNDTCCGCRRMTNDRRWRVIRPDDVDDAGG